MTYTQAANLHDALTALQAGPSRILAGCTDYFPARPDGEDLHLIDISRAADMRGITATADGWRIGAATTWAEVIRADLPPAFDGLKAAAREVGSIQIQNVGTVAGNICNASPAADSVPPLLTLDATVEMTSLTKKRLLPIDAFLTGPRQTALRPGEIVSAVLVPNTPDDVIGRFRKLGSRRYLVISIAMVAGLIGTDATGRITTARIAVGACSAVAQRQPVIEAQVIGKRPEEVEISIQDLTALDPIDDMRADAAYRMTAAADLIAQLLRQEGAA